MFGNVESKKKLLLEDLWALESLEVRGLSDEEKLRNATMINDLERTTLLEEVCWREKSRTSW